MLDTFAAMYGWTLSQVASHTLFQLNKLSKQMSWRQFHNRKVQLDSMRTAYAADRVAYARFIDSLKPDYVPDVKMKTRKRKGASGTTNVPPGLTYKKAY